MAQIFERAKINDPTQRGTVVLLIDGGTTLRRTFLNVHLATLSDQPLVVFLRAFRMRRLAAGLIAGKLASVQSMLEQNGLTVFAVVSDNASAMIRAIRITGAQPAAAAAL